MFVLSRHTGWAAVGFYWLLLGGIAFGVGLVCLLVCAAALNRCAPDVREAWLRKASRLLGLLKLNIPIALACGAAGILLMGFFERGRS